MNKIDNLNALLPLLIWENKDNFYFIQVIKRRKDNPGLRRDMKRISEYFIYSEGDLLGTYSQIKSEADLNNARVYMHLRPRNASKVALKSLMMIGEYITSGNPQAAKKAYTSACGKTPVDKVKIFMIDADGGIESALAIKDYLFLNKIKVHTILPTKSGYHFITAPFRLDTFCKTFPGINVHKDSPTLLYAPNND